MEPLPPIPIPWQARWREFRTRFIPVLMFVAVLIAATFIWIETGPGGVPGIGEAEQVLVTAPQSGILRRVLVPPYHYVEADQPLALLEPVDPRASFDLLQAELALARLQTQPSVAEDNAMNFERIRVELLRTKSELAVARVNLTRSESEVQRYTPLWQEKLITEDLYELALRTRDAYKAEVEAKESAIALIEQRLAELSDIGVPRTGTNMLASTFAHLDELRDEALNQLQPITLVAPRSGMVHYVYRQSGENVLAGEPLFSISPLRSERIVGYLRQPYSVDLQVGMKVEVVTRDHHRRVFESEIAQVGARVEVITNTLAIIPMNSPMDAGLPFVIHVPSDVFLRPGEIVDVRFPGQGFLFRDGASPIARSARRTEALANLEPDTPVRSATR